MSAEGFSVLMSVYHKEQPAFFDLSLESIMVHQSRRPDEFVLICDGDLTEGLESIIVKYSRLFPDIFKVYRKESGGLGKALNFGLAKCSFPLVARADSDDICDPRRFEKQVAFMDAHPEIGIISSYLDEFDSDWTRPIRVKTLPLEHDELVKMARFRNPLNHMAVMMRRDLVLGIGSYQNVLYVEDYYLWLRAIVNGIKLANIGEVLVHARVGNGMVQRRGSKAYISSWKTLNNYMKSNGLIGPVRYMRNMISVRMFVYMPPGLKVFVYNILLRKKAAVS